MSLSMLVLASALTFPQGFKWCAATAAHQIEGANVASDWWRFEQEPGRIKRGEASGPACDHWNRLAEDTALLQDLGVTTYRFSLEWAKIEPTEGTFDLAAVEHYKEELALLEAAGIEPLVTLMHFTLPQWVAAKGGWEWDGVTAAFKRYVAFAQREVGPGVRDWITLNEPTVVLTEGYVMGRFPPAKTDLQNVRAPARNMVRAHAAAYRVLHAQAKDAGTVVRVGLAHHLRIFDPAGAYNPLDRYVVRLLDDLFNWSFIDAVTTGRLRMKVPLALAVDEEMPEAKDTQDFLGINYYTRDMVKFVLKGPLFHERQIKDGASVSDLGWEVYPEGLYRIVTAAAKRYPNLPILITENGMADAKDDRRPAFLRDHLTQLHRATSEGVPIEGYCHWSLMDNFEWAEGFEPRFGLYHVDYATQTRTPRASARLFGDVARRNGLD